MVPSGTTAHAESSNVAKFAALAAQLGVAAAMIRYFQLESQGFFHLSVLAFTGFVVHYFLPLRHRLPFFCALSLAGIALIFGWQGLWLVTIGLILIGACHLPFAFWIRVAVLAGAGTVLALARGGWLQVPWSVAIWPILGSMFMFRLIVYLYDTKHDQSPTTWWQRLSYFFLLPNVCFPLFPLIDYKTFRRTYYNEERHQIYQVGVEWILRGLTQLVLYRLVYYYFSMAPSEIDDAGDLGRYVVSGILLYLRISGQFHVIVGMLRLFGFNLPETHHLYFLSTSFTDFWRRINIYWKDFMMKTFFYPAFFKLRRRGEMFAILLSTAIVFVATWVLHAYQWFWIRGSYLLAWNDVLFWTILGLLVISNTAYETRRGRERLVGNRAWTLSRCCGLIARTSATFIVISVLWSLWTSASVSEFLHIYTVALNNPTVGDTRLVVAAMACVLAFAGATLFFAMREPDRLRASRRPFSRSVVNAVAPVCLIFLLGTPELYARFLPESAASQAVAVLGSVREVRLSGHDADMLERGYYEDLLSVQSFNTQLWDVYASWPLEWSRFEDTGGLKLTGDFLKQELVPSKEINFRNASLHTNRWGMRDKDYERHPPAGTYRFALVGSSHVMGYGVDDAKTFDSVLESRLNAGDTTEHGRYEVLNFAVDGYTPLQELYQLDTRVLAFKPHTLLYVAHFGASSRAALHLLDIIANDIPIPYRELQEIADAAGVSKNTPRFEAEQRLMPFRDQILASAYRRMVAKSREHGTIPVWVYLPTAGETVPADRLDRFAQMAERAGFVAVSLVDCFDGHESKSIWFGEWDRHPNAFGHGLIAKRLYERLLEKRADALQKSTLAATPSTGSELRTVLQ